VALISLSLSGCNQLSRWDREYVCNGHEQSVTSFTGDKAAGFRKQYPNTIDFHIRADHVLVKSHQTGVKSTTGGVIQFSTQGSGSSLMGQFDPRDNILRTYESRSLQVDGDAQEVHTTGQYHCVAASPSAGV
jgi:hypothetical protein